MRPSPRRGLPSRVLITLVLAGLLLVGLPVGPPVSSGGWPDLGLGRAWNALADLLRPDAAAAEPTIPPPDRGIRHLQQTDGLG